MLKRLLPRSKEVGAEVGRLTSRLRPIAAGSAYTLRVDVAGFAGEELRVFAPGDRLVNERVLEVTVPRAPSAAHQR